MKFIGPECNKILKFLDTLEQQLPVEHRPYITALYELRNLNRMGNLVSVLLFKYIALLKMIVFLELLAKIYMKLCVPMLNINYLE